MAKIMAAEKPSRRDSWGSGTRVQRLQPKWGTTRGVPGRTLERPPCFSAILPQLRWPAPAPNPWTTVCKMRAAGSGGSASHRVPGTHRDEQCRLFVLLGGDCWPRGPVGRLLTVSLPAVNDMRQAARSAASYMLFDPGDSIMQQNLVFYRFHRARWGLEDQDFLPREVGATSGLQGRGGVPPQGV